MNSTGVVRDCTISAIAHPICSYYFGDPFAAIDVVDFLQLIDKEAEGKPLEVNGYPIQWVKISAGEYLDRDGIRYVVTEHSTDPFVRDDACGRIALIPWEVCTKLHYLDPSDWRGRRLNFTGNAMIKKTGTIVRAVGPANSRLLVTEINTGFTEPLVWGASYMHLIQSVWSLCDHVDQLQQLLDREGCIYRPLVVSGMRAGSVSL